LFVIFRRYLASVPRATTPKSWSTLSNIFSAHPLFCADAVAPPRQKITHPPQTICSSVVGPHHGFSIEIGCPSINAKCEWLTGCQGALPTTGRLAMRP